VRAVFFAPHWLPLDEMEYTTMAKIIKKLGGRWVKFQQAVEKSRQRRSRVVQALNVPPRVRFGPLLAAALPDGHFEQPAVLVFVRDCIT
jgi:hypothetical protein